MPRASEQLIDAVHAVAETSGFRASYIANAAELPIDQARDQLAALVEEGDLEVQYELLCPSTGRLIHRYSAADPLPVGETITAADCEEFEATRESFWLTYKPTHQGMTMLATRGSPPGKAPARRRRRTRRTRATPSPRPRST